MVRTLGSTSEFAKWNNIGGVSDDWQNRPTTDITFQNCIIANPLYQQFGAHTECVNGNWSWFYNLFANSRSRNPMSKINDVFVNNVLYNCSAGYTTHTSTKFKHDIVNNYFIAGPGSGGNFPWYQVDKNQSIYCSGNLYDSDRNGVLGGSITTPYWYQGPGTILTSPWSPLTTNVPVYSPAMAYAMVVSTAGALPRDEMDALVISQVKTLGNGSAGTGPGTAGPDSSFYSSQTQTGLGDNGFGTIAAGSPPVDTDQDGMPDYFEEAIGSSVITPNHNAPVLPGAFVPASPSGYTLMDEYLHFKASPHVVLPMNGTADVDLRQYAAGFTVPPVVYTVLSTNGVTAVLQPDGHTVRITPGTDYVGRAQFDFRVSQGGGIVMTQTVLAVVSGLLAAPAAPADLQAAPVSSSRVVLTWTDRSSNEAGFRIERSSDGVNFVEIASVGANATSFTNTVAPSSTYWYRVRAYSLAGDSPYSNTADVTTPAGLPAVPASITATPANSRVNVSWEKSPGATGYRVRRSTVSDGGYVTIAYVSDASFEDRHAVNGTTYYYVVAAVNEHGESDNSAAASATPSNAVTYPAEDADYGGGAVFENTNGGFNGTGYVNSAPSGSYLQFDDVDAGGGGTVTLRFRYALGNTARTGLLIVNGVTNEINFSSTGAWTTWVFKDVTVSLNPGTANFIRLETTGQDLANIDELTVLGTAVSAPAYPPVIDSAGMFNGQLVVRGFAGLPFQPVVVLASTNLGLAPSEWTPVSTNQLDSNGAFHVTNAVDISVPQRFYRVQVP